MAPTIGSLVFLSRTVPLTVSVTTRRFVFVESCAWASDCVAWVASAIIKIDVSFILIKLYLYDS
ncbi:hypothetical protein D3C80_911800 [compost metagenome]